LIENPAQWFVARVAAGEAYLLLLPVYVSLLVGERLFYAVRRRGEWDDADATANVFITFLFLVSDLVVGAVVPVALMAFLYRHFALWSLGQGALGWLTAFILFDLTWYVDHRIAHRTGFFWAMHHVHHSSMAYNTTVASRGFVVDNTFLSRPMFYLLPLLGVAPLQFIAIKIATSVWGIAQHTRVVPRLPVLDRLFATPSNHRVHHGSDKQYLDRNYGEVLMVWDHLFGTYTPEAEEPTYGVTEPIHTNNPVKIELAGIRWLVARIRSADGPGDKLRCLYMPPGWRPPVRAEPG
jgi:sterol desaturase/sphingolipid hydroxylase (fatty acid hydroxylase superfamily)